MWSGILAASALFFLFTVYVASESRCCGSGTAVYACAVVDRAMGATLCDRMGELGDVRRGVGRARGELPGVVRDSYRTPNS